VKKREDSSVKKREESSTPGPGLRERKKRQTRLAISAVATRLIIERGFDSVTMAEVAAAAEVSVNTVFNYFATKEDLFFDRAAEVEARPSELVRARKADEPLVAVLQRALREARAGFLRAEHMRPFLATVESSPALQARGRLIALRAEERLAVTLFEEFGGDRVTAQVAAAMVMGLWQRLIQELQRRILRGESAAQYMPPITRFGDRALALLKAGLGDYGAPKK
jgi:AcrR family transcriptional regulator